MGTQGSGSEKQISYLPSYYNNLSAGKKIKK